MVRSTKLDLRIICPPTEVVRQTGSGVETTTTATASERCVSSAVRTLDHFLIKGRVSQVIKGVSLFHSHNPDKLCHSIGTYTSSNYSRLYKILFVCSYVCEQTYWVCVAVRACISSSSSTIEFYWKHFSYQQPQYQLKSSN